MVDNKSNGATSVGERKMTSLSAFLQQARNRDISQTSALNVQSRVGTVVASCVMSGNLSIGSGETEKFASGVTDVVMSKDFTDELSNAVGTPHASETEDEFVARAKAEMSALLRKKLSKN